MSGPTHRRRVLLTGATGFVGRHIDAALEGTDWDVRRTTRGQDRATQPGWVYMDVERPETLAPALEGCDAAVYLIHSIDASDDYPAREARCARAFRDAAKHANVRRIIYLGGVQPANNPSRHLESRVRTGELLRAGDVTTIELRAGLIIGAGGSSWLIVRDLAARLPAMLLPRWLGNLSWPLWIGDVCTAVLRALELEFATSVCFDIPGAERISHEALLRRVAASLDKRPPLVHIPLLSPRLSAYWIALVTRADLDLARELVEGLQTNLDPSQPIFWEHVADFEPTKLDQAIAWALSDETENQTPSNRFRAQMRATVKESA